jgi:hypothetical protein
MTTRTVATLTATLTILALTGCGIGAEDSARNIGPSRIPYPGIRSPATAVAGAGAVVETLFMLKDNMLVTVDRRLPAEPTIDDLIHELLAGPTHDERNIDITSIITGVQVKGTVATVELAANLNETGRTDEILAIAQIVCTLTARPYISGANFTRDGHRIGVPRADGSLSQGPLTIADYASLLADS